MATQPSQKRSLTSRIALFIAVVLPLLGLAYAIARVDILRARIGDLRSSVTQQRETQTQQDTALRALQTQLDTQREQVSALRDELRILSADRHIAERVATQARLEVLYLLRMATMQLQHQDAVSATATLQAVQQRLVNTPRLAPAVLPLVQQALAQLGRYPHTALTQADSQLQALSRQALTLPVAHLADQSPTRDDTAWQRLQQALSKLFFIRRGADSSSALLTAADASLVQQQLSVLLAQSRLSLLQRDQVAYQQQLQQALQALQQFFVAGDAGVQAFEQQLTTLLPLTVAPALPDLGAALDELERGTGSPAGDGAAP